MWIIENWEYIVFVTHLVLATIVTAHSVLNKRDTRAAIGWTGLAWLAPIIGSVLYFCLGINRIHRKAIRLGLQDALNENPVFLVNQSDLERVKSATAQYPTLAGLSSVGRTLSEKDAVPGNEITALIDGDQTFPSMVEAINGAERSVALLSYIFDNDRAGEEIIQALVDASKRGAEIRVLIDDVGSKYSKVNVVKRLQDLKINAASFLPTKLGRLPKFTNLRNHRKILVVDGKIGFTGGTNIREAHWLGLKPDGPTQCLHFRLRGPIVAHLQETFVIDWAFATGEQLSGETWFPELGRKGSVWARGVAHGPDEDFETLAKVMFAALGSAQKRVRIVTPYFIPDSRLMEALAVAALRGVEVQIYLPSDNNVPIVNWAAAAQLGIFVQYGCKVYKTRPPFDHTKLLLIDDIWALIGSTNWDPRSLRLNFEFNVECYDEDFVCRLHQIVDEKAQDAEEITLQQIQSRNFPIRLRDGLARLASPYL
ncbi:MAG: cardiolipin synthase [Rhizobiaceae bacterium]